VEGRKRKIKRKKKRKKEINTLTTPAALELTAAIYSIIFFEASVFPAPLSPLIITQ